MMRYGNFHLKMYLRSFFSYYVAWPGIEFLQLTTITAKIGYENGKSSNLFLKLGFNEVKQDGFVIEYSYAVLFFLRYPDLRFSKKSLSILMLMILTEKIYSSSLIT
jgi:hypothetical protein